MPLVLFPCTYPTVDGGIFRLGPLEALRRWAGCGGPTLPSRADRSDHFMRRREHDGASDHLRGLRAEDSVHAISIHLIEIHVVGNNPLRKDFTSRVVILIEYRAS